MRLCFVYIYFGIVQSLIYLFIVMDQSMMPICQKRKEELFGVPTTS